VTFNLLPDGSLIVVDAGKSTRTIQGWQIAAHRVDPAFEAALQAASGTAGNLSAADLATLPKLT
jgi:hypothetical protein